MKKVLIYIFATIGIISTLGMVVLVGYMLGRNNAVIDSTPVIENIPVVTVAPTETTAPTATEVPTETPTPESTATPEPTHEPTATSTPTPVPTNTPTPLPTNTPTPVPTVTPAPTSENEQKNTPVPTPTFILEMTEDETQQSFNITAEDFYYDENGELQYTVELMEFIRSFDLYKNFDNEQICGIIESFSFRNHVEFGKLVDNVQGYLTDVLSEKGMLNIFKNEVPVLNITDSTTDDTEETPKNKTSDLTTEFVDIDLYLKETVNVYTGPSADFEVAGILQKGEKITALLRCNETGWYGTLHKVMGPIYIDDNYLSETPPAA